MNKLKVEMHNNSFFWYKVYLYIIKKNRLTLFSEIKPVSFNLYITSLSHHHINSSSHYHIIITSSHHHITSSSHHHIISPLVSQNTLQTNDTNSVSIFRKEQ